MLQRSFLTGLAVTVLVVQACGSDDGRKRTMQASDAGMGGEAGADVGPGSGGSSAGEPPSSAGEPNVAGMGGSGEEPSGGTGGQGPTPPDPELLFVVRDDALGLTDSAVANETYKQSNIYTTGSATQDGVDGTNQVKVVGTDLGLADGDAIIAFAELQPEPEYPFYLFSVAEGAEGGVVASTADQQHLTNEPTGGDVFFSDGVESYRYLGEGGDLYGYNGLSFSESSLGLSRGVDETPPDELHDMQARDANQPLTELYFTVNADSVGLTDSAVEATPADERGCTVFKSALDGSNSVAFSCAELGLIAGDQIDALTVYGSDAAERVVFSVTNGSEGAAATAVATAVLDWGAAGSALFSSAGDDANQLLAAPTRLGLGGLFGDELDGLTVQNVPIGSVEGGLSCMTTFDPFAAGGGELISNSGTIPIGSDVTVLIGRKDDLTTSLIAFDTNTCAFLQQKDMAELYEDAVGTAIVRLANWSKAMPLDNVEYFQTVVDDSNNFVLQRYDGTGTISDGYVVSSLGPSDYVEALTYERTTNQLYLVTEDVNFYWQLRLTVFPVPDENVTTLDQQPMRLTLPCTSDPNFFGADPAGNLLLGQLQADGASLRVCSYSPSGQLQPAPYFWTPGTMPQQSGFIANGSLHVSVTTNNGAAPLTIERGAYALP